MRVYIYREGRVSGNIIKPGGCIILLLIAALAIGIEFLWDILAARAAALYLYSPRVIIHAVASDVSI